MSVVWIIFKVLGALILLLAVLVAGLFFYSSIDREDNFYLINTQFSDYGFLANLDKRLADKEDYKALRDEMSVYVHRLSKGHGAVFAHRWYSNGDVMTIDDESFKKLTVWIDELPKKYPVEIDFTRHQKVKGAYTRGGSAWPRAACSGYLRSGSLILDKSGGSIDVSVIGVFVPAGSGAYGGYCEEQELNIEFSASELKFEELTPWLGLQGNHPYAETYR